MFLPPTRQVAVGPVFHVHFKSHKSCSRQKKAEEGRKVTQRSVYFKEISSSYFFLSRHTIRPISRHLPSATMGGQAFRYHSPPLDTSRIPADIYLLVRKQTRDLLLQHFTHVEIALEAPGKVDYGDSEYQFVAHFAIYQDT